MKRKFYIFLIILFVILFSGRAFSDFGSFSGNSDYGSSSRSSSTSSSSSSSSSSRPSYSSSSFPTRTTRTNTTTMPIAVGSIGRTNNFFDSDSDLEDSDEESFDECMGVAFVFLVFFAFWLISRTKNKNKRSDVLLNIDEPVKNLKPMSEYLELDPEFDEERIKTLMSNLYVQMQDTWREKDISSLRPYMTDAFFSQMNRQLEQFRKYHRTDYTERIAVLNVGLKGFRQSAGMDYITVSLNSRIVSYVLDDLTGELVSGDKNREKFMEYGIEISRKSGTITQPETEGIKSATCPHCGAPLKLNASAKCEYCGSVITTVNTDWAICGMKGISQRTV